MVDSAHPNGHSYKMAGRQGMQHFIENRQTARLRSWLLIGYVGMVGLHLLVTIEATRDLRARDPLHVAEPAVGVSRGLVVLEPGRQAHRRRGRGRMARAARRNLGLLPLLAGVVTEGALETHLARMFAVVPLDQPVRTGEALRMAVAAGDRPLGHGPMAAHALVVKGRPGGRRGAGRRRRGFGSFRPGQVSISARENQRFR